MLHEFSLNIKWDHCLKKFFCVPNCWKTYPSHQETMLVEYQIIFKKPFWWHLSLTLCLVFVDADRARKHGLDEFVQANPVMFDHHDLFNMLQTLTLDYRLNDAYTCLVRHPLHSYVHKNIGALSWIELKNFQHLFLQFCWTVPCEALYTIKW